MVGLRVFDIGALVVWLVWFFRLRDDDDDDGDDFRRGKDDGREPEEPCGPGGLKLPLPDAQPWQSRAPDRRAAGATAPPRPPRRPSRRPRHHAPAEAAPRTPAAFAHAPPVTRSV